MVILFLMLSDSYLYDVEREFEEPIVVLDVGDHFDPDVGLQRIQDLVLLAALL